MRFGRSLSVVAALTACLTLSAPAFASEPNAYLRLQGLRQGSINGGCTTPGFVGQIIVFGVDHEINVPFNEVDGAPTAAARHSPLVITKGIDEASPLLHNALKSGEVMNEFTLQLWRPDKGGTMIMYLRIRLTDARIVKVRQVMPNNTDTSLASLPAYEEVSFAYSRIERFWSEEKTTVSSYWNGAAD